MLSLPLRSLLLVNCLLSLALLGGCRKRARRPAAAIRQTGARADPALTASDAGGAPGLPTATGPADTLFRGYYLRETDLSGFRPCGATEYLPVVGRREALVLLRERWRFTATRPGRPLFAVVHGGTIRDSAKAKSAGASTDASQALARPRNARFFLIRVDTLRAASSDDCRKDRR